MEHEAATPINYFYHIFAHCPLICAPPIRTYPSHPTNLFFIIGASVLLLFISLYPIFTLYKVLYQIGQTFEELRIHPVFFERAYCCQDRCAAL
jgi:hypothetical protein